MEEDKFFTKSKLKSTTNIIEAWGMMRKHYDALCRVTNRELPHEEYMKLWRYRRTVLEYIRYLESLPALVVVSDDEDPIYKKQKNKACSPMQYIGPCVAIVTTIETYGGSGS